jgi:hypothetical protein
MILYIIIAFSAKGSRGTQLADKEIRKITEN